jgi:hypothetical protein
VASSAGTIEQHNERVTQEVRSGAAELVESRAKTISISAIYDLPITDQVSLPSR